MSKEYSNGTDLSQKIMTGVNLLADYTAATLGPRGRNVILQADSGTPIITKDGVTVAKHVELDDPFENVGAQIIKQASSQTNSVAGDGTTTATVLAREILEPVSYTHLRAHETEAEAALGQDVKRTTHDVE